MTYQVNNNNNKVTKTYQSYAVNGDSTDKKKKTTELDKQDPHRSPVFGSSVANQPNNAGFGDTLGQPQSTGLGQAQAGGARNSSKPQATSTGSASGSQAQATATDSANRSRQGPEVTAPQKTGTSSTDNKPQSAKDWKDYIQKSPLFQKASQWANYLKKFANKALNALRNGITGPFRNQLAKNGWSKNVLFAGASNSQHTVGWMVPGGKTAMGYALEKTLKNSPSLVDALRKFAGKPYPSFPKNAKAKYWHADKVGKDDYFNSPLRFSKNTQKGPNPTKNIFVGISGGPEGAFAKSISSIAKTMKEEFNTTNFVYHRGTANAEKQIARAFSKIRAYALKNPNKPISLAFMLDTHGGTSGGNRLEGSGRGFTGQFYENEIKQLHAKYLGDLKNVGVHYIFSCCHAGAFLV